jgi:hypothetical protein
MLGLLYGLISGSGTGWTLSPILSVIGGLAFFALFCRRQRTAPAPLIEPSLLKNRGFTAGLILGLVFCAAVAGLLYVLSLFMQNGLGYTPLHAAVGLSPIAAGIVIASIASYQLIATLGRTLIVIGLLITLLGTGWLFALILVAGTTVSTWSLVAAVLIIGLGMGTCFGTAYDITLGDIAIGAATVTTVYFHIVATGDQARATTTSLVVVAAVTLGGCGLVWLLQSKAQPQHH